MKAERRLWAPKGTSGTGRQKDVGEKWVQDFNPDCVGKCHKEAVILHSNLKNKLQYIFN